MLVCLFLLGVLPGHVGHACLGPLTLPKRWSTRLGSCAAFARPESGATFGSKPPLVKATAIAT